MKETMGKNQDDSREPTQHKFNTSPIHKKPLTPTKDHPLMDLEKLKAPKSEFMDDSDEPEEEAEKIFIQSDETKPNIDDVGHDEKITNAINQIPPELDNYQVAKITTANPEDDTNNNYGSNQVQTANEGETETGKSMLAPEKVMKRRKSPSQTINNNNNTNMKNNNRISYPTARDRSEPRIEASLSKSTERIDGELF